MISAPKESQVELNGEDLLLAYNLEFCPLVKKMMQTAKRLEMNVSS